MRETQNRNLEQKTLEIQGLISAEVKERQTMDADLQKYLNAEIAARDESIGAERRLRESGEIQLTEAWKAAVRDERDTREGEAAQVARDLAALKTQLAEENAKREDERSQQHLALQKVRTDVAEIQGERKVDVVSMREAFNQVTDELKAAQRARKEDVDRIDASIATVSQRVDANARQARDKDFALEQAQQGFSSELQREMDERAAVCTKLEQRIGEEHRFTEAAVAAETRAREENDSLLESGAKQQLMEESRRINVTITSIAAQVKVIAEDLEKDRALHADTTREVAKSLASIQGSISTEEQARVQSGFQAQRHMDLLREEVATETKERRAQGSALAEDVSLLQRGLRQRDDRSDSLANQLKQEVNDLRERFVKEARLREAAIAQVEQSLLDQANARAGTPARSLAPPPPLGQLGAAESAERWRQAEEEMERTRRAVVQLQSETTTLNKSVTTLNDGFDLFKAKLGSTADELAEVQKRLKTFVEMEGQVVAARDEMRKETAERKAECERLAIMIGEGAERLERTEQSRIKAEGQMRQEVLDTRTALKKEARDRELMASTFTLAVREEAQKREEMV